MKFLAIHIKISTHTPTRGVTKQSTVQYTRLINFYSHAREGRDSRCQPQLSAGMHFYSHAREGRDTIYTVRRYGVENFYSHAREGRDIGMDENIAQEIISTHTPARGVTWKRSMMRLIIMHFYSHAREGRDWDRRLFVYD